MSSPLYPIFLNLKFLNCLVVGGGSVAARKVATLRGAGASVCVVSPKLCPVLAALAKKTRIQWIAQPYAPRFLRGMRLVIAATDDAAVNRRVFGDAEKRGILVNVVDDLDHCRFLAPATCRAGSLEVAVTSGGAAPVIAKLVRDEIAQAIIPRFAPVAAALGKRRSRIRELAPAIKKTFWEKVTGLIASQKKNAPALIKKIDRILAAAQSGNL